MKETANTDNRLKAKEECRKKGGDSLLVDGVFESVSWSVVFVSPLHAMNNAMDAPCRRGALQLDSITQTLHGATRSDGTAAAVGQRASKPRWMPGVHHDPAMAQHDGVYRAERERKGGE